VHRRSVLSAAILSASLVTPALSAERAMTASRLDSPAATPLLQIIDREAIERSGKFSLAEVLRDLAQSSAGSPRPRFGNEIQTFAGADLRGLDTDRTLLLINGLRDAVAPDRGFGNNLNLIPLALIERIEVLPSGAGAIHGANAIGGVINVITRDGFRGVEVSGGTSWSEREGGEVQGASMLAGTSGQRGSIVVGASYDKRDIVFARDRDWSTGGASVFSNNFLTSSNDFLSGQGPNGGSGNVAGCQGPGFSLSENGRCVYDFTLFSADEVETLNQSLFAMARFRIDEDWTLALNARASNLETFSLYAPTPSTRWAANGFRGIALQPGSPNHPSTPPTMGGLNPLWEDYAEVADEHLLNYHRFAANGPREFSSDAVSYNLDLNLQGRIGRLDVSFGAQHAEIQHAERIDNLILSELAQVAIDTGAYNLYDPFATPAGVRDAFSITGLREARSKLRSLRADASTDLFELPGGMSRVLVGAEWRDETYIDQPDALRASRPIPGAGGIRGNAGERESWAAFTEAALPLTDRLDAMVALRWDEYDFIGSGWSGRVAVDWRPLDRLSIHSAWSRSLRAEPLPQASSLLAPTFTTVFDGGLVFPDPGPSTITVPRFRVRNPALDPEIAEQIDIGFRYALWGSLELGVNAFDVKVDDRIFLISSQTVRNCLVTSLPLRCPDGIRNLDPTASPPVNDAGLGVARDPSSRQIVYIQTGLASLGTIETRGLDLRLNFEEQIGEFSVSSRLEATWVDRYRVDGRTDIVGLDGRPDWRGRWQTELDWRDFALTWIMNHIAGQDESRGGPDALPSWTTHDLQLRWTAPWDADLALGVDNLADRDPVLDAGEDQGFNFELYDGYGRLTYLRYTQRF